MAEFIEFMILIKKSTIIHNCQENGDDIPDGWVEDERAIDFRNMAKEIGLISTVNKAKGKFLKNLTSRHLGTLNAMNSMGSGSPSSKRGEEGGMGFGGVAENLKDAMESAENPATPAPAPSAPPVSRTRSIKVAPSSASPATATGPSTPAERLDSHVEEGAEEGAEEVKSSYSDPATPGRSSATGVAMEVVPAGGGGGGGGGSGGGSGGDGPPGKVEMDSSGNLIGPSPKRDLGQGMSETDLEFEYVDGEVHSHADLQHMEPNGVKMTQTLRD